MSQTDQPADALPSHEDVHLSAFFEQAVDGMMLLTCNGDIVRVNQAFAAMHGYASPEEMLSIRLEELDAPPSTGLAAQCVARAAAGERLIFEAEHFRKDGTVFPVSVTASRVAVGEQWFLLAFHRDITGYKRAEAALRDSEHHLRLALEVGSIGVFDVELGTGRSSWSTGIQDLWAVPEGFAGDFASYCWEHIHPEDLDRVKAFYTKVVESGQVDECEFRVVHSDGTFRWLRWRGGAVVDAHTGGIRIVGVNIDITERKRLEVEREAALVKYRTLFDVLPLGVTVADRSGHIVESNRLAESLLGVSLSEQRSRDVGDPQWAIIRSDGTPMPPSEFASVRALAENRVVLDVEMGLVKSATETTWLGVTAAPVPLPDVGVVITYGDISARKREAAVLAEREEVFASIVRQASDAIVVVDGRTGRFVEFNTATHEGLGYTREEFLGFGVGDIQAEHDDETVRANLNAIRDRGELTFETRHRHRDGSLRDVRVSARALHVRGRDYIATVWTDITDRKRAEARAVRDGLRTAFLLDLHQRASALSDRDLYDYVLERAVALTDSIVGFFHQVSDDQE